MITPTDEDSTASCRPNPASRWSSRRTAIRLRAEDGTALAVRTSLRRIAAELLGMPRAAEPVPAPPIDPAVHTQRFSVDGQELVTVRSAIPGLEFDAPRAWGQDRASW